MEFVKPPDAFSFEEPNAAQRWKQFRTYFIAAELSAKSKEVQVARLLNAAGAEAKEIHELSHLRRRVIKRNMQRS